MEIQSTIDTFTYRLLSPLLLTSHDFIAVFKWLRCAFVHTNPISLLYFVLTLLPPLKCGNVPSLLLFLYVFCQRTNRQLKKTLTCTGCVYVPVSVMAACNTLMVSSFQNSSVIDSQLSMLNFFCSPEVSFESFRSYGLQVVSN